MTTYRVTFRRSGVEPLIVQAGSSVELASRIGEYLEPQLYPESVDVALTANAERGAVFVRGWRLESQFRVDVEWDGDSDV